MRNGTAYADLKNIWGGILINSERMEKEYITKCPYKRQNYCMLRDDNCAPNSLKCKKNKRVFHDNTFSTLQNIRRNLTNKVQNHIDKGSMYLNDMGAIGILVQ